MFPHAKFIHVIRDVDAVVAALTDPAREAIYRSHARRLTEQAAYEHWLESVRAGVEAEEAFGSDTVSRVRRDDLVADPEGTIRRCLSFVGEPFSPACLRPFR